MRGVGASGADGGAVQAPATLGSAGVRRKPEHSCLTASARAGGRKPYVPPEQRWASGRRAPDGQACRSTSSGGGPWFSRASSRKSSLSVNGITVDFGEGGPSIDTGGVGGGASGVLVPLLVGAGTAAASALFASRSSSSCSGDGPSAGPSPHSQPQPQHHRQPQPQQHQPPQSQLRSSQDGVSSPTAQQREPRDSKFAQNGAGDSRALSSAPAASQAPSTLQAPATGTASATTASRAAINTLRQGMGRTIAAAFGGGSATPYRGLASTLSASAKPPGGGISSGADPVSVGSSFQVASTLNVGLPPPGTPNVPSYKVDFRAEAENNAGGGGSDSGGGGGTSTVPGASWGGARVRPWPFSTAPSFPASAGVGRRSAPAPVPRPASAPPVPAAAATPNDELDRNLGEGEAVERGRKAMQALMSSGDSDPRPVPLEYLRWCTEGFCEGRKIGEGAYSCVYAGRDRSIRRKFAVKRMRVRMLVHDADLEEARNTFEREIATLKHFRHPNIARMYAYYLSPDLRGDHCLVYELASNGSLYSVLQNKHNIHWTTRINIALDLSKALEYLHTGRSGQICYHRDIKSANVCLRRNYTALLIDCGISKMIPNGGDGDMTMTVMDSGTGNGARGTPGYICPSFSRRMGRFTSANDVFSLGVVLAEIFTGLLQNGSARGGERDVDMFDRYSPDGDGVRDLEQDAADDAGEWDGAVRGEFAGLAAKCLLLKPEKRPSIGDIVQRLGHLASRARPRSPGERNSITVLSAAPLVYADANGDLCPLVKSPNFLFERDQLTACIKESRRDITLTFDTATDDRLHAAATRRCGALHFSGHGHPAGHLLFEDGNGGAHWIGEEKLYDSVHEQPFSFAFVSACFSLPMGKALVRAGVPHVVCCEHDQELRDDAAMKFTHTFYYALAEGYTVKDAFEKGRTAVGKRFEEEVSKYVLLPEGGDHDVPLFDAQLLEWNEEGLNTESTIPSVPRTFLGREVDVYSLLQLIVGGRLVNLFGEAGIGCSSLALAVGHYIRDRRSTILGIETVFYVRKDKVSGLTFLTHLYQNLVKEGRVPHLSVEAESTLSESLVEVLSGMKVLVIFDGVGVGDSELLNFVALLLEKSNTSRVLLTSGSQLDVLTASTEKHAYELGPLGLEDAALLFVEACQNIRNRADRKILLEKVVDGELSPGSGLSRSISGGNPAQIVKRAQSLSDEEYAHMLEKMKN